MPLFQASRKRESGVQFLNFGLGALFNDGQRAEDVAHTKRKIPVANFGNYDVAVIDTRPDVNMLMTIALHAASGLVVPTRATMTDLASTGAFFSHLANYMSEFQA
jgi:cellulose biosynthesis protein BcsQ